MEQPGTTNLTQDIVSAWGAFQSRAHLTRPESEADYARLVALSHHLIDTYNCDEEPYTSLLDLVGTYMLAWEEANEPPIEDATPAQALAFYMEQQGVTQYQLGKEGVAPQTTLSRILSGERGVSKALAKRLAERFGVSVEVFL